MSTKTSPIPKSKSVGTKIPLMEYNMINNLIKKGLYLNSSDFVRESIRDKLKVVNEIDLRDIPRKQKKEEIIEYCEKNKTVLLSDIANDLSLDIFEVNEILDELIEEGIINE